MTLDSRAAHQRAKAVAGQFRLPFGRRAWRGLSGNWAGAGIGSSIDFQDHLAYLPGDDPRYINWQAYARSGQYTMKLFRQEVSPHVDLAIDGSRSMAVIPEKATRAIELVFFALESALQGNASVRIFELADGRPEPIAVERVAGHDWQLRAAPDAGRGIAGAAARLPWRPDAMRVLVSDLLFAEGWEELLRSLGGARGAGVILAPFAASEANPDWFGNIEFEDSEGAAVRHQRVDVPLLDRYRAAFRRHFELWRDRAMRHGVVLGRVAAENRLEDVLAGDPLAHGAVELQR